MTLYPLRGSLRNCFYQFHSIPELDWKFEYRPLTDPYEPRFFVSKKGGPFAPLTEEDKHIWVAFYNAQRLHKGEAALNRKYIRLFRNRKHLQFTLEKAGEKRERTQFYIRGQKDYITNLKGAMQLAQHALMNFNPDSDPVASQKYIDTVIDLLDWRRFGKTQENTRG